MEATVVNNKVIVMVEENPAVSSFKEVCQHLGLKGIDPLNLIDPESHLLSEIYKDMFKEELANQLMAYLVSKQSEMLIWSVLRRINDDTERLVLVNTTLLTKEDVRFIIETNDHVLQYKLEGSAQRSARDIYDGSKTYRDKEGI